MSAITNEEKLQGCGLTMPAIKTIHLRSKTGDFGDGKLPVRSRRLHSGGWHAGHRVTVAMSLGLQVPCAPSGT
ncbi:MAG: hypothetical protein ONB48_06900 [candidate division KSB1 bacterium]|nr:hypothetical protein [candidate division KSB1 bacterium]MDZ7273270.1 hypothetical protein [candidate division KSB1 bacterium]MDZ7285372.1 hypothetical protein [candidate division KSB1 bacterium]MDZ7298404.1 hypothetical protein [candidate division KSB1 bacterium]MDZ7306482.1 hypothetical protein [candidate division KSB1 bacterium]